MAKRMPWDDIVTGGLRVIGPCVEDDVLANPRGDTRRYYQFAPGFSGAPLSKHVGHTGHFTDGERGSLPAVAKERFTCSCGQTFSAPRRSFRPWSSPQDNPGEILDSYHARRGDRITFEFRAGHRTVRGTGTVVMASGSGDGWVLNMGGAHGTPQVIRHEHVVRVTRPKRRPPASGLLDSRSKQCEYCFGVTKPDGICKNRDCAVGRPWSNPPVKVGDIVMASAQYMRSAGIYSGPEAFTKWRITSLSGSSSFSIANLVSLGGPDSYAAGTKRKYNCANLVLADRRHLERNPGPSKRDPQHHGRRSIDDARGAARAEHLYGFACGYCGDQQEEGDPPCPRCGPFGTKERAGCLCVSGEGECRACGIRGGPCMCQVCHPQSACGEDCRVCKGTKRNPPLILVHAMNPPVPADVERAWLKFHQRKECDARTVDLGHIAGTPEYTFALGRCEWLEIDGQKCSFSKRPWVVCAPEDQSIWIVSKEPMNIGTGVAGRAVTALTYDPVLESGKDKHAVFRHEFDAPHPTLDPVGRPKWTRAILLNGGRYKVDSWVRG